MKTKLIRSLTILGVLSVLAACAQVGKIFRGPPPAAAPLALWVECQGDRKTLDAPERIDALVEDAKRMGVDVLFAQVYRGGLAWYRSDRVDSPSWLAAGFDPLGYLLSKAKDAHIEVHAWINVFSLSSNAEAPVLKRLGEDILTRDNFGRLVAAYADGRAPADPGSKESPAGSQFLIDAPGLWLDPGIPEVREFQLGIVRELLEKYPALNGVHLDFIRYPYALPVRPLSSLGVGIDFGYAEQALARFEKETGKKAPLANQDLSGASGFDSWRREQVTKFVEEASRLAKDQKRRLSVAALAWADRAYLSAFQDWRGWLESGLIDAALVMNYSRDKNLARHVGRAALAAGEAAPSGQGAWIGLGAYLFQDGPDPLLAQMKEAASLRAPRIVLFSYDAIAGSESLKKALSVYSGDLARERLKAEEYQDFRDR
ncbi:MAG: family 10 glycosylhydrolase [Bdellovibrionota bacterium]